MRAKDEEREAARRLRAEGWSLNAIAAELGVAKSSVSVWVRDVPGPPRPPRRPSAPPGRPRRETVDDGRTRVCAKCREELQLSAFNRRGEDWQWYCRSCFKEYFRARADVHRAQVRASAAARRASAQDLVLSHLERQPCVDCGEPDPIVLEFDHLRDKHKDVARMVSTSGALSAIEDEIAKCEVVCVNCHRRRSAERGGWRRAAKPWWDAPPPADPARRRNVAVAYSILDRGCVDCRSTDIASLDFDHVGPKTANVMKLAQNGVRLERLLAEIDQCVVRCGNCHRRKTARTLGSYRVPNARILDGPP